MHKKHRIHSSFLGSHLRTDTGSAVVQSISEQVRIRFTPVTSGETTVQTTPALQITCPDDFAQCNYKCRQAYSYDQRKAEACMEAVASEFKVGTEWGWWQSVGGAKGALLGAGLLAAGAVGIRAVTANDK